MAKRKIMRNRSKDRKVFENTANKIHIENLDTKYKQGGIRF